MSDWPKVRLGELGAWYGGGTPSKNRPDFWAEGTFPWLSPKDMGPETLSGTRDQITQAAVDGSAARLISANSVAVVVRSGILERKLPVAVVPFVTTINQDMRALLPGPGVSPGWVAWALRAHEQQLLDTCRKRGTTVASLEGRRLMDFSIPLPDLHMQRRIVAILEHHVSRLDAADAGLVAVERRIRSLWMSTLTHQTSSGRDVRVSDCLAHTIGGVWGEAGGGEVDVRVLRVTELDRRGELDPKTAAARSVKRSQLASRSLQVGDLLLEKSGGGPATPVGRVGLVRRATEPSVCSNFMQLMRPNPAVVLPEYLHAALMAFYVTGKTESLQKASTNIRNLRMTDYLATTVRVPDLADQRTRVAELARAREFTDGLERSVDHGRRRLAQLRRGLLKAAFAGRLVSHQSDVGIIDSPELAAEATVSGP